MFSRILIANRGEIACRIIDTARRMGIRSVAVYSDADRDARHVALADEAYRLGPAAAAQSYLLPERIIEVARRSGAEAIHPGYGFLSENPEFVEACEAAGIVFIGPGAEAIRAMGLKDAAKRMMESAGVPVVPGYHGAEQEPQRLLDAARAIGFPVLIKATAGGGGKGMRRVDDAGSFDAALASARREAASSFGEDRVLVEKYLQKSRHVEIQVFADARGNVVHLFERDCSLQRRHQKVIEEAPAPDMPERMRRRMGEAAVAAARAIGYRGAGTVEFIADTSAGLSDDRFYFMEMNTRLQVEHPVTELITGQDLVQWQILVAQGEALPLSQDALRIDGHAIEARIYAEDPANDFRPATGTLRHLHMPRDSAGVRVDSGVRAGDTITPHYDPMIAKLIVHARSRPEAVTRMRSALGQVEVAGCTTNVGFLARLIANEDFAAGDVDTGLIERNLASLQGGGEPDPVVLLVAALHAVGALDLPSSADPWETLKGWRAWSGARQFTHLLRGDVLLEIPVSFEADGGCTVELTSGTLHARALRREGNLVVLDLGSRLVRARVLAEERGVHVFRDGVSHFFGLPDRSISAEDAEGILGHVNAPLPGRVVAVNVSEGDVVERGAALVVIEAMKMETTIASPRGGRIAQVGVGVGDQVDDSTMLVRFDPGPSDS